MEGPQDSMSVWRSQSEKPPRRVWQLPSIKAKLKDRLFEAQEALLQQSKERAAIYSGTHQGVKDKAQGAASAASSPAPNRTPQPSPELPRRSSSVMNAQDVPRAKREELAPLRLERKHHTDGATSSYLSLPVSQGDDSVLSGRSGRARANTLDNLTPTVAGNIRNVLADFSKAYMGIDWFIVQEKKKQFSLLFFIEELYYWCYAGYIVTVILLGAVLMWYLEPQGAFTFPQALYTSASCVSQSGLAVVDWSKQATSTYVISFCLILLGSASLLHIAPVVLRQNSFRMQASMSAWRKFSEAHLHAVQAQRDDRVDLSIFRRCTSDPAIPEQYRHQINHDGHAESAKRFVAHKENEKQDSNGKPKTTTTSRALEKSHRLEYKALAKVLKIMLGYWLIVHLLGVLIFYCYFRFGHGPLQEKFREEGLHPLPHAFYLAVSSFQNNGLVMTPSSVMDFVSSPLLLSTIGTLILLGNTGLPIMVRFIAASWRRRAVPFSETKKVLDFLLEHPRRCFTHMFPAVHTMWLMIVVIALNVVGTVVILVQDWDSHAFNGLQSHQKIVNALFQTVSTRTAGVNSINIAQLSQGTTFFMAVMMYFSTTPTVVTMRLSAAQHELDITGRVEGVEEDVLKGENSLKGQARRYLTQDATYLVVICFLICCLEQDNFSRAAKYPSPDSDGIYTDFGFFKVLFELLSAYGTCGLSLGFENQTFSFSGVWSEASQMLLVFTMLLGRLRGLPDSIDASVRVAMVAEEAKEEDCDFVRF